MKNELVEATNDRNLISRSEKILEAAYEKAPCLSALEVGIVIGAFAACLKELKSRNKQLDEIKELVE